MGSPLYSLTTWPSIRSIAGITFIFYTHLEIKKPGTILDGVVDGSWVYFVHSYRAKPKFDDVITAESDYGVKVPAVVEKNNFFGTQFHPEKSGDVGKIMIQNFLSVCKK